MGEGAALLVLEAADVAERRGAVPYAEVLGYGATSDAHHMVQPRADGTEAARAATIALADAGVEADAIDYVNAHASSTPIGDVAEARAIALALGDRAATVPVSGTKALYGHPLGASGAIEAAICALAIRDGWAPASVNLREPDPDAAALLPGLLRAGRDGTYRRVLSTSFGFGGLERGARVRRGGRLTRRSARSAGPDAARRPGQRGRCPSAKAVVATAAPRATAGAGWTGRSGAAVEAVSADPDQRPDARRRPPARRRWRATPRSRRARRGRPSSARRSGSSRRRSWCRRP